ncbi:hypothetical protein GCQ56_20100 [Marinifilum sp. N1E240]|uniref:hypothetical protein n=1 Tax=Marinifilum sp. N1E240 TaxID=2608082 RepID=UPI00128D2944|nr:hypothetical protein [Marinifilum sp. N1E240]MPQ49304.1 hypothetical protein [Marinifilum sp. N1E240]
MKNREYRIKVHSIVRFIIAMIGILVSSLILINDHIPQPDSEIISIIQFLAVFVTSFYLAHLIGMGKAKVVLTQEGIQHIWERRFILSCEKSFNIPWNLVDNYVFQEDRTFDSFIINLTNKTRYKVNRLNVLPIKDDFNRLVKDFPRLSNDYKNGLDSDTKIKPIKEGESIYASKSFRWVFYFLLVGFLILALTKVFNPDSGTTWSSLGVIGSGVLFYGMMIIGQKKNN